MGNRSVTIKDYQYTLPDHKIARYPLPDRAASKLLRFHKGDISHHTFRTLPELLPEDSLLVFNNTRVIPARMIFHRRTGARIEVFLLEPVLPSNYEENLNATSRCSWTCLIGNAKKWKEDHLELPEVSLKASRTGNEVQFTWTGGETFAELLEKIGRLPLPPYLDRDLEQSDYDTYQTVYAKASGAVAAPTAGLHFTEEVLTNIRKRRIEINEVTLHVSAGTFQPMKTANPEDHPMHREHVIVSTEFLERLLKKETVLAVGTTSMRTLESLYWYGVQILEGQTEFLIPKLTPYEKRSLPTRNEALRAVLDVAGNKKLIQGQTEIFIFPGYTFQICKGLVTNFHLPGSTLMLLVGAFVGEHWRDIYQAALDGDYRFLSYGDSSLLLP